MSQPNEKTAEDTQEFVADQTDIPNVPFLTDTRADLIAQRAKTRASETRMAKVLTIIGVEPMTAGEIADEMARRYHIVMRNRDVTYTINNLRCKQGRTDIVSDRQGKKFRFRVAQ